MSEPRDLRIYLEPDALRMARAGTFGFVTRVRSAFETRGFRVSYQPDTDAGRLNSVTLPGQALFLMKDPYHPRALSMRRAYFFPYWRIEATAKRWEFDVAGREFVPGEIDPDLATAWHRKWGRFLFKAKPAQAERTGLVYVALQGRLLNQRSFQTMSPVEMVAEVQARAGDRKILLGLHPGERYSAAERDTLEKIATADPRVSVQTGGMEEALRVCDLVVTQNSTAALLGFFFRKPAILFGEIDFHHQMPRVSQLGVDAAWRAAETEEPDCAGYLFWFLQLQAIKADAPDAETRIAETCRRHGWPV